METNIRELIGRNLREIRGRIAEAAARAGRRPEEIRILGATKTIDTARVALAAELGLTLFGENYVQEALPKIGALPHLEWHLIGRLQTNKARFVVGTFRLVQTVDRWDLAHALSRRAVSQGLVQPVLVEVNLGDEPAKGGVAAAELPAFLDRLGELEGLEVRGLMGMPPYSPDPEEARPYFATLKSLWDRHNNLSWQTLSMGMSGDYQVAIEEGSTLVRIGTALFGPRAAHTPR